MPIPDRKTLKQWARNYVDLWNAGDKEAWVENWKSVAPGDFRMLDPVGTPEREASSIAVSTRGGSSRAASGSATCPARSS